MNQPVQMMVASRVPSPDPLRAIARFGDRTARDGFYIGLIIALLSHTAALAFPDFTTWAMAQVAADMREELHQYFWQEYDVVVSEPEVEKPETDKPEPEEEEVVEDPEPAPEPDVRAPPAPEPEGQPDPPPDDPYASDDEPPPPSEAADILTAPDDAPVDLTDEGFVDKDGSTHSGAGMVSAKGKGNEVVRNRHAKVGGTGDKRSRGQGKTTRGSKKARNLGRGLGGSYRANCPFPPQADLHQVDSATVQLLVTVDASGHVKSAQVLSDPGYGFGQQAKRCVMSQSFPPALDADGKPVTMTGTMNYRFKRH